MEIINSPKDIQKWIDENRIKGKIIGFVPTMGYLHAGHLSLIDIARKECDLVIISIFVNPTQFAPNEDLDNYPQNFEKDKQLAKEHNVDVIFYPSVKDIYPSNYSTYVNVESLTDNLCGASRPEHFRGVTTIVCKLFNIIKPHLAVFGQKDAQQSYIIKRMVEDLNMDIDILIAPIMRESDGLAMSSRNVYLTSEERKEALSLYNSLQLAKKMIIDGENSAKKVIKAMRILISKQPKTQIDYISIVDTNNLKDIEILDGEILIALAVKVGKPRLIDNMILQID